MQLGARNNPTATLTEEIDWIATNGFDYIDLTLQAPGAALESTDRSQVQGSLQEHDLGIVCQAAPDLPIEHPSPLVRQAALDEIRRSIDAAHGLGATVCSIRFRGWPDYLPEAEGYDYYRQLLQIVLQHGHSRGVDVALENGIENRHQLKYSREIFHRLPMLRFCYDIGHSNIGSARSVTRDYLFALADRLDHIHLSDNDGESDSHLPIGTPRNRGINLSQEFQDLQNFRYDGNITLEIYGDRRWLLATKELVKEAWTSTLAP